MSTNTKLSIKSTSYADEKKTITDTINYVNPNISNATALEFAQRLNALSLNSYKETDKIETTNLDTLTPKPERNINTLTYDKSGTATNIPTDGVITLAASELNNKTIIIKFKCTYDGTAPILENFTDTDTTNPFSNIGITHYDSYALASNQHRWVISLASNINSASRVDTPRTITFNMHFIETEQLAAYDKSFTINITEG